MWLAERGFVNLYGFDIAQNAIDAGKEICASANLHLHLWADEGRNPESIPDRKFSVIIALNWTMLLPTFQFEPFLDTYRPHLAANGFLIIDAIDAAYDAVTNNRHHTSDWDLPECRRRPSEYQYRISEDTVAEIAFTRGFTVSTIFCEHQAVPKNVFVLQKVN